MLFQIPPEIWGLVFSQLPPNAHLKLRQVCRAWRDITDTTPELWTYIHISSVHQFAKPAGARLWLKLSHDLEIDVFIKVPRGWSPTLGLLHGHLHRFRTLELHAPTPKVANKVLASIVLPKTRSGAPLLTKLCITIDTTDASDRYSNRSYFDGFCPAPRLQRLAVDAEILPHPSIQFLSTITSLTITSPMDSLPPCVKTMLDTIAATPLLEFFKYSAVDVFSYQETYSINYPRVVRLPHLKKVDVTVPGCGQDMLQCFEAPLLSSVRLDGWREYDYAEAWDDCNYTDVSALIMRLPQRSPSIRSLDIHCAQYLKSQTLDWLFASGTYSQLEELRIEDSTIMDTALKKAVRHGPLRRLELRSCLNVTGYALIDYVTSRHFSRPEDFQLLVGGCPGVTGGDLAKLSQLVDVEVATGAAL